MQPLPIVWKRLVTEGETCPRCGSTQQNLAAAMTKLQAALGPLGIAPALETQTLDEAAFRAHPAESNRIWIGGKRMEEWLGARAGSSPCCEVCGDLPCRTMEVDGVSFEAIPEALIVKAGIIAASTLLGQGAGATESGCCAAGGRCC